MNCRIDFDAIAWESPMKGVRCKAFRHGQRQIRLVEYTAEMEPHWCEKGHVGYVLEGEFEIEFDDRVDVFRAGDGAFIPSGRAHRHMARVLSGVVRTIWIEDV